MLPTPEVLKEGTARLGRFRGEGDMIQSEISLEIYPSVLGR